MDSIGMDVLEEHFGILASRPQVYGPADLVLAPGVLARNIEGFRVL